MKKIGFIGAFEKTDLILYISKLIVESGRSVLFIDLTRAQRARYVVPTLVTGGPYVTQYEGIDVACTFSSFESIAKYLKIPELEYDFIMMDTDTREAFKLFNMQTNDINYFVTNFETYSLKRGLDVIGKISDRIQIKKILFSKDLNQDLDEYLNFLSKDFAVEWDKEKIVFPYDMRRQYSNYGKSKTS